MIRFLTIGSTLVNEIYFRGLESAAQVFDDYMAIRPKKFHFGGFLIMITNDNIAPDFSLQGVDGNIFSLQEYLSDGNNVLLVFLRHLG